MRPPRGTVVPSLYGTRPAHRRSCPNNRRSAEPGQATPKSHATPPCRAGSRAIFRLQGARADGRSGDNRRRVRLHHRRRRIGRLHPRQSPVRRCQHARAHPRSRRPRQLDLVSHPGRLSVRHRQSALGLVFQDRAGRRPQRPQPQLSARQGDRRLVVDQRHDLYARPGRRLRSLAPAWAERLGLERRAAVFQEARKSFHGRERGARGRRRMARFGAAGALGSARCVPRRRRTGRHQIHPRLQSRRQRRHLRLSRQPEARPALVGGQRLPQAGAQTAELAARNRLPGRRHRVRRPPRRGRALVARRPHTDGAVPRRGHFGGGLDRLTAHHAAVRCRAGAAAAGARHPGRARPAGRRRQSAGSPAAAA